MELAGRSYLSPLKPGSIAITMADLIQIMAKHTDYIQDYIQSA